MFFLPWPSEFKSAKTFLEFFEPIVYSRKVENVQIPIKGAVQKFSNLVAFAIGFLKGYKMLKTNDWK